MKISTIGTTFTRTVGTTGVQTVDTQGKYSLERLIANMACNYPLVDDCSPISSNTNTALSTDFICDISIAVAESALDASKFYISSISAATDGIYVRLAYKATASNSIEFAESAAIPADLDASADVATRTFAFSALSIPNSVSETIRAALKAAICSIIIGTCRNVRWLGTLTFSGPEATGIVSTCISKSDSPGIRSIEVISGGTSLGTITEDFILVAGEGIEFRLGTSGTTPVVTVVNKTTVSTEAASIAAAKRVLLDALGGHPICKINGIPGDNSNHSLQINGADCTTIEVAGNGLSIANTCSTPCCDSTDITKVQTALASMEDVRTRLINYFEALSNNINSMQARLASLIANK